MYQCQPVSVSHMWGTLPRLKGPGGSGEPCMGGQLNRSLASTHMDGCRFRARSTAHVARSPLAPGHSGVLAGHCWICWMHSALGRLVRLTHVIPEML